MLIGPLDDHTYYARSVFTRLGLRRKLYDLIVDCITSQPAIVNLPANAMKTKHLWPAFDDLHGLRNLSWLAEFARILSALGDGRQPI